MKRICAIFFLACFLLLSGCSSGGKALNAEDIDFVFSCKIDVASQDGNYTCAFERAGRRDATVEILSGSGKGLKWYWSGNGFHQTYLGLSAENEICVLPDKSFASTLVNALDCAEQPGTLKSTGNNTFSGSMDGGSFTITADGGTGEIRNFSMSDRNLKITFHDFKEPDDSGSSKTA